jgi:DNA mismatch repair protein MLH3
MGSRRDSPCLRNCSLLIPTRWHRYVASHAMSIRPLPKDVIEKITSSSSIVSLNGAVCGLVRNSLDAGARKVNIVLDYVRGNCTVEDDGEGISAEEFSVNGGLAKPNSTS